MRAGDLITTPNFSLNDHYRLLLVTQYKRKGNVRSRSEKEKMDENWTTYKKKKKDPKKRKKRERNDQIPYSRVCV